MQRPERPASGWGLLVTLAVPILLGAYTWSDSHGIPKTVLPLTLVRSSPDVLWEADVELSGFFPNPNPVVQAVGSTHQPVDTRATDRDAYLLNATELYVDSPGVNVLTPKMGRNYGTYELVELIQQVGARFASRHDGASFRVGDLSARKGGTIRDESGKRVHSSHRNGLDADIPYLHMDCTGEGRFDQMRCPVGVTESLELMRMFMKGGPDGEDTMVDVMYVGSAFRDSVCRFAAEADGGIARRYREVIDKLELKGGHEAHFHLRIKCPETSKRCAPPRRYRPPLCKKQSRGLFARML